jgi:hypothetical protein
LGVHRDVGQVDQVVGSQVGPKLAIAAVQAVTADHGEGQAILLGVADQMQPQGRLRRKGARGRDVPPLPQSGMRLVKPDLRQVQFGVDHGPRAGLVVAERHPDLAQFDFAFAAQVLAGRTRFLVTGTGIAAFVQGQHAAAQFGPLLKRLLNLVKDGLG